MEVQSRDTRDRVFLPLLLVLALSALTLVPLLRLHVFPFTDLPNHLTEASIYKHRNNPDHVLSKHFVEKVSITRPVIAHVVFPSLFPSVENGARILYALYAIAMPVCVLGLIILCRGDPWLALLSITLLYNYNTTWGFTGFTLAIPLFLLYGINHIVLLRRYTYSAAGLMALVLCLIYWSHILLFLLAVLCYVLVELSALRRNSLRGTAVRLLPLLPSLVLMTLWILLGKELGMGSTAAFLREYYVHEYLQDIPRRVMHLSNNHFQLATGMPGSLLAVAFVAGLAAPFLICLRRGVWTSLVSSRARRVVVVMTVCAAACYAFLPGRLPGQSLLFERYVVVFLIGLIVLTACLIPHSRRRLFRGWALILALAYCGLWGHYFLDFGTFVKPFNRDLLEIENAHAQSMAAIIDQPDFRGRPVLFHFNNYHIVWNGGISPTLAAEYRFGVVGTKDDITLPRYVAQVGQVEDVAGLVRESAAFDHLLVHGPRPFEAVLAESLHVLVRRADGWALFRTRAQADEL